MDLESLSKSKTPVSATWVQTHRLDISHAIEEYKTWGSDSEEEQCALHDMVWYFSMTWSYEMISELMPHLSMENKTTELVRMVEAIGSENDVQYNSHCNLALCEPFFKRHATTIPIKQQVEVLQSLINQEYLNQECLDTAVRLCEIIVNAIDWKRYEQERDNDNQLYWGLSSEMVLATEKRPQYAVFFDVIKNAHPKAVFSAMHYVVAMQVQGGYSPSDERIELFNERLTPFLNSDLEEELVNVYSTINKQLRRQSQPPLQVPPQILGCMLHKNLENREETPLRNKKM